MFPAFPPSPLLQIHHPIFETKNIRFYIKRDELIGGEIQGNKWRKLKYNLLHAKNINTQTLITFGGPWSNHIYATAAACKMVGIKAVGIIRGYAHLPLTTTLQYAKAQGMELIFVDKETYRQKNDTEFNVALQKKYPDSLLIPEGGTTPLSLIGLGEMVTEINEELSPTVFATAVGTGGTLSGIVKTMQPTQRAIGFSSLKGEDTLTATVAQLTANCNPNFHINYNYHFGGYAKVNQQLIAFIQQFYRDYAIRLDPVYTGKMMYGLWDLMLRTDSLNNETIVAIHTGGLQGLSGFPQFSDSDLPSTHNIL